MQNTGQPVPPAKGPGSTPVVARTPRPSRPAVPPEFQAASIEKMDQPALIRILKEPGSSPAAVFQKGKACHRLAQVGTAEAVPPLAALLTDPLLANYARFGLEAIPDPSADEALRAALPKVKGSLLVGVVNSIGQRKDAAALEPLAKLLYGTDADVAQAAASALGYISSPQAAKTLQDGLSKTKGAVRAAVAAAGLVCAEGLLARGDRKGAFALYDVLSRLDIPKAVRLAAMHSTIAAETSLTRPRVVPTASN
jgi:HEAT repeat protein